MLTCHNRRLSVKKNKGEPATQTARFVYERAAAASTTNAILSSSCRDRNAYESETGSRIFIINRCVYTEDFLFVATIHNCGFNVRLEVAVSNFAKGKIFHVFFLLLSPFSLFSCVVYINIFLVHEQYIFLSTHIYQTTTLQHII